MTTHPKPKEFTTFSKILFIMLGPRELATDFIVSIGKIDTEKRCHSPIGHLGFWAGVVYGNGIFMTISPSERHNYLAVKLSRYRQDDLFVAASEAVRRTNLPWASIEKPS